MTETSDSVAVVTINRPEAHNALNADVLSALRSVVEAAVVDRSVGAVVLTGAGTKAFSAGADLKEVAALDSESAYEAMHTGQQVMRAIERAEIPVIAAVNGVALGGGFELVLASTFAVLSRRAFFGLPETGLGLIPGYGGTQRLPRTIGAANAAHLMLTGARIGADRAYALGLTPLPPVEPDDLLPTAVEAARTIAAKGPSAVRAVLRSLEVGRDAPLDAGLTQETGLAALAVAGAESSEGVAAFLERRLPVFATSGGEG